MRSPSRPTPSASPNSRTLRFEGEGYGATVSFFLVTNDPGQGPSLHRPPYDETFTVLEGEVTRVVGDDTIVARAGDTAVAPANTWHRFSNSGGASCGSSASTPRPS